MKHLIPFTFIATLALASGQALAQASPTLAAVPQLDKTQRALSNEELKAFTAPQLNAEQKRILLGKDDNENGIRDELDAFIKSQKDLTRGQRNSLSQLSLALQDILVRHKGKPTRELAFALNQAEGCFYWQMGKESLDKQGELYAKLMALLVDTPARKVRFDAVKTLPEYKSELSWQWAAELRCTYNH